MQKAVTLNPRFLNVHGAAASMVDRKRVLCARNPIWYGCSTRAPPNLLQQWAWPRGTSTLATFQGNAPHADLVAWRGNVPKATFESPPYAVAPAPT